MIGTRFTSVESTRYVGRTRPYSEQAFDLETTECHRCGVRIGRPHGGQRLGVCRDCYETDVTYLNLALGWERPATVSVLQDKCRRGHWLSGTNRGRSGCVVCERARTHIKNRRGLSVKDIPKGRRERVLREALTHVLSRTDEVGVQLAKDALGASS